jgi:hypothetical protein
MRIAGSLPLTLLVPFVGLVALANVALPPVAFADPATDACIRYWGEPRFNGGGYNHLVHVANSCPATADCAVTTNVSPEPAQLEVSGNSEAVINTFLSSPTRTFVPHVVCKMRSN